MKIIDDDFTFTSNDWGAQNKYGTGLGCFDAPEYQGKIRMDLRGTDFHFPWRRLLLHQEREKPCRELSTHFVSICNEC